MVRDLIERMTGVLAQISPLQAAPAPAATEFAPASPSPAPQAARSAGFGLVVEQHTRVEESEHTRFAAEGVVRTADRQKIHFTLLLDMQRTHREETWSSLHLASADSRFALRGEHSSALSAVRSTSIYLREDGSAGTVQQIDLAV